MTFKAPARANFAVDSGARTVEGLPTLPTGAYPVVLVGLHLPRDAVGLLPILPHPSPLERVIEAKIPGAASPQTTSSRRVGAPANDEERVG